MVLFYSQRGDLAQVPLHDGSCPGLLAQLFIVGGVTQRERLERVCARLTYHSMDVSWGSSTGTFYVHRVNRIGYAAGALALKRRGAPPGVKDDLHFFLCSPLFLLKNWSLHSSPRTAHLRACLFYLCQLPFLADQVYFLRTSLSSFLTS